MSKKIILSVFLTYQVAWGYVCPKPVDSKKVVLFIGLNKAPKEISSAAEAACQRGESFKTIPTESEMVNSDKLFNSYVKANDAFFDCQVQKLPSECVSLEKAVEKAHGNYTAYQKVIGVTPERIKKEISTLADQNKAVSSLIASGHDGGGTFGGGDIAGTFTREDLASALKNAYQTKPNLLQQLGSVYMWGCYTMGPSEVSAWKEDFPQLKVTAGFYDKAPLAHIESSWTILKDLMLQEQKLYNSNDDQTLLKNINAVRNINNTYVALNVQNKCGSKYYYNTVGSKYSQLPSAKKGNHFINFGDVPNCQETAPEREKVRVELIKYFYGSKSLPGNTSESDLRDMYGMLRAQENCINQRHIMNPDRVLLLIFQNAVNANFENNNLELLKNAQKDFDQLLSLAELNLKKNPADKKALQLKKYLDENKAKFFSSDFQFRSRKEINDMIHFIEGITHQQLTQSTHIPAVKLNNLKRLKKGMDLYLFNLSPECMDTVDWHSITPGRKPEQKCKF